VRPARRIAVVAVGIVVVGLAGIVGRVVVMAGVLDRVKPLPLACKALPGVVGAEDIAVDREDKLLFVSASDRRATAAKPSTTDGIYTLSLASPGAGFVKLAGAPRTFHPHGIGLFRAADGSLTLMAVNHVSLTQHAVDIFAVKIANGRAAMSQTGDIQSDKLNSPNDVLAVGPEQFYVTNDHGSRSDLGKTLENYLLLPRANVLYFDGTVFREVASGLVFANGIAASPDGAHVYVSESTARRVETFGRDAFTGALSLQNTVDMPSGPDNIDVDPQGTLWVAAHPKLFALLAYGADPTKPSPSQVFELPVAGGVPGPVQPVYANAGAEIGASSVGVAVGHDLFIGSIFDPKILDCALP
jgi:arylesterase / paraoxonase